MANKNHNFFVNSTYGVLRLSGKTARLVCSGLSWITPFKNSNRGKTNSHIEENTAYKPLITEDHDDPLVRKIQKLKTLRKKIRTEAEIFADQQGPYQPLGKRIEKLKTLRQKIKTGTEVFADQAGTPSSIAEEEESPKKSIDTDSFLKGMSFEDEEELVRAEIYVKDFTSSLPAIRNRALDQIKRLSKPVAIEILQKFLIDEKEQLKMLEILNALSGLDEKGELDKSVFTDFLQHQNPALRLAAIRALSRYKDEEGFDILSSAITDDNADVRKQTLNLLCLTYKERGASSVLKLLYDADDEVRKSAILLCGALKLQQPVSSLITFLSDPSRDIQKAAVESLRKITNQKFGFNVTASQNSKSDAGEAWRLWWRDNQATFGLPLKKEKAYGH